MNCPMCNNPVSIFQMECCDICEYQACRKCYQEHNCLDESLAEYTESRIGRFFLMINHKARVGFYFELEPNWIYLRNSFFLERQITKLKEVLMYLV